MKRIWIALFISAFAAGALPGGSTGARPAGATQVDIAAASPRKPFDAAEVFELLYANRPDSALALLDSFRRSKPSDAYVLALKARVLRDGLNDEDNNKDLIRRSAEPIHAVLDTAIALADEALDRDVADHKNYFYRGYAWLNKSQLLVLTRSYWSAGRAASRGKGRPRAVSRDVPRGRRRRGSPRRVSLLRRRHPGVRQDPRQASLPSRTATGKRASRCSATERLMGAR